MATVVNISVEVHHCKVYINFGEAPCTRFASTSGAPLHTVAKKMWLLEEFWYTSLIVTILHPFVGPPIHPHHRATDVKSHTF